jgi:hypothetical protein
MIPEARPKMVGSNTINNVMFYLKWLFTPGLMDCVVTTQVQFEQVLMGSAKLSHCLNLKLDQRFGSCIGLNLGPDFGQVRKSSGSNFGSGPNRGINTRKICQ